MMTLHEWAARWRIPPEAVAELATTAVFKGVVDSGDSAELSEAGVTSRVRLEAVQKGVYLWRNNRGAGKIKLDDGSSRFMRWGLANDSKPLGDAVKSGDLIGFRVLHIGPELVGRRIAQFVSREIKHSGWKHNGSLEDCAQIQWANLVNASGGDAKIVTGPGSFD